MKKIMLLLMLCIGGISVAQTQDDHRMQSFVMTYLQEKGYTASFDENNDIIFKMGGLSYYIIFQQNLVIYPTTGTYTHIQVILTVKSQKPLPELIRFVNDYNCEHYGKLAAYSNNGENRVRAVIESVASTGGQAVYLIKYALQMFPVIVDNLKENI